MPSVESHGAKAFLGRVLGGAPLLARPKPTVDHRNVSTHKKKKEKNGLHWNPSTKSVAANLEGRFSSCSRHSETRKHCSIQAGTQPRKKWLTVRWLFGKMALGQK